MPVPQRFERSPNILRPGCALPAGQIDKRVHTLEQCGQLSRRFIHQKHHIMKALRCYADNPKVDGQPFAWANLAHEMRMMFEVHGAGFAPAMVGIGQPDSRIKRIARIIEHHHEVTDIYVFVAVGPVGSRDGLVTRGSEFLNLF